MSEPNTAAMEACADEDAARALRKQAAALELIRSTGKAGKDALGMIEDTPLAREAFALGEAYRQGDAMS